MRAAIPNFSGFLDRAEIFNLASNQEVESRLILRQGSRWDMRFGPFSKSALQRLPHRDWTLLIQGVNLHHRAGAQLLSQFDFIPHARLDDLMVSYAAPGGGVGPHVDSYDVFLLQGFGRRRWQISRQKDLSLRPNLPLKILRRFVPQDEWDLEPGDMLYLPPMYAHNGVALEACTTYSIGFRSPSWHELGVRFFEDVAERQQLTGRYADPALRPTRHPGLLPPPMISAAYEALSKARWRSREVGDFLGRYLTEPKQHVMFNPPRDNLSLSRFRGALERAGAQLALKSLMLYSREAVFINGEAVRFPRGVPVPMRVLADQRILPPMRLIPPLVSLLKDWHDSGFLHLGKSPEHRL